MSAHLTSFRPRYWDRLLTRFRAHRWDTQLAAGLPPGGNRLRALRAAELVAPGTRAELADNWEKVLDRARAPRRPGDPSAPLARGPVFAARDHIQELATALRVHQPVSARGVAMAHLLLTDGSAPLYRSRSRIDLSSALTETISQLDPNETLSPFAAIIGDLSI